jgi:predicted nucleic acid-binding protein
LSLLHPDSQFVIIEAISYLETALEKFRSESPAVSFTDCIVMAVADYYGVKEIFGSDKQFEEAGYARLKPSLDWKKAA